MKRVIYAVLVMIISINFAMAETPITPKINEGDRAILFSFSGLGVFGIGGIDIGSDNQSLAGIGGLYYINEDIGIRLGLHIWRSGMTPATGDNKQSQTTIGFSPGVQYHLFTSGPVTVYTGGQVFYGRGSDKQEGTTFDSETTASTFGLSGIFGFQYFIFHQMSFSAEYRLGFDRSSSKTTVGDTTTEHPTFTNFGISAYSLTLAVFFN